MVSNIVMRGHSNFLTRIIIGKLYFYAEWFSDLIIEYESLFLNVSYDGKRTIIFKG